MPFKLLSDEEPTEEKETLTSQVARGTARTASRIGEQIAGAPGDIFSLVNEYIAKPATEYITGEKGVPYEETQLGKLLLTTQEHKRRTQKSFGEVVKPKNDVEKFIDNVVQDATAIAIPGPKGNIGKNIFSSLAKATGANLVGEEIKDLTKDEQKSAYGKMGTLFLLSMVDKPRAAESVAKLYSPLQEKVQKLSPVSAETLENNLTNLKNKMLKGTQAPSEQFVINEVDAVLSKIKDGKISPEELWATKRSLNEKLSKVLFDIPNKGDQQRARKLAKGITYELKETLSETKKQDPKFYKDLQRADKAFETISKSNFVANYIEENLRYTPMTSNLLHIFGPNVGGGFATAVLPYQTMKILYRVSKSPELSRHYLKALSAAGMEDAAILNREMKKLDQGLEKQEKKQRFKIVP